MDFSKFSNDDFDVKEWVNAAFKAHQDSPENKDAQAATLVMKLQLYIQEVNNSIEEISLGALQNLPRVMRDTDAVKQEALFLKEQMMIVREDIKKVEQETGESMKKLVELEDVKTKMEETSKALQEADNWTTLSADVEDVFLSQDSNTISAKLIAMQNSLKMLIHYPEYTERCQHLEVLKNRLEAMLSTQVISTFNNHNLESAQRFVKIFKDIDRLDQLFNYYHKCHRTSLLKRWRDIVEDEDDRTLVEWITEFYDILLNTWQTEAGWCSSVFEHPVPVVCELFIKTLSSLEPSLPSLISTHLEDQDVQLESLIKLRSITIHFIRNLQGVTDLKTDFEISKFYNLITVIHRPLVSWLLSYRQLEEVQLLRDLDAISWVRKEVLDCAHVIAASVGKVFNIASGSLERCIQLTDGLAACGLVSALSAFFKAYIRDLMRVIENMRAASGIDSISLLPGGELKEEWTLFQHSLRIIQTCGELILKSREFDSILGERILNEAGKYCPAPSVTEMGPSPTTTVTSSSAGTGTGYNYLRRDPSTNDYQLFTELITALRAGGGGAVLLCDLADSVNRVNEQAHRLSFDIVFNQLKAQLEHLPQMEVWNSSGGNDSGINTDLPTFSLSPMEYITKIGQYLMTLPQQLEPFSATDNINLETALLAGKLPFPDDQVLQEMEHMAEYWLGCIARGCMQTYVEAILKIPQLTDHSSRQLCTDIGYLHNVVDALGIPASESLVHIENMLSVTLKQLQDDRPDCPQRLYLAIIKMRSGSVK